MSCPQVLPGKISPEVCRCGGDVPIENGGSLFFAAEAEPLRQLASLTRCRSTGGQAGLSCCRTGVGGVVLLCCVSEVGDAPLVVVPVFEDGLIGYRQYSVPRDEIGEAPLND